jgi:DNA-binding NarL/FixJ family response regulator
MTHFLRPHSHVVVADSRPKDYRNLVQLTGDNRWHLHFLTTGSAAIRFGSAADLWIINTQLSDMSGFDLFELLGERAARAPTFLVGDQYSADEERRACGCGAALYLCKDANRSIDCRQLVQLAVDNQPAEFSAPRTL